MGGTYMIRARIWIAWASKASLLHIAASNETGGLRRVFLLAGSSFFFVRSWDWCCFGSRGS